MKISTSLIAFNLKNMAKFLTFPVLVSSRIILIEIKFWENKI